MWSMLCKGDLLGFGGYLATIGKYMGQLVNVILYVPLYLLFKGLTYICLFAEQIFKSVSGIGAISFGTQTFGSGANAGKDLVWAFITDKGVQDVFWVILGFSIILLIVFTIVALMKTEFSIDMKNYAKGPIIGRAVKAITNFLVIPVVSLLGVFGVNYLTRGLYDIFGGENASIATKSFYAAAYNANRARSDPQFANFIINHVGMTTDSGPFAGLTTRDAVADKIDEIFLSGKTEEIVKIHYIKRDWGEKIKELYETDQYVDDQGNVYVPTSGTSAHELETKIKNGEVHKVEGYADWWTLVLGYPDNTLEVSPMFDIKTVNYYYDLSKFSFLIGIGSALIIAWNMLGVCLALLKRVFELTILFLLSPAMISLAPLDDGKATSSWRGEFSKRVLATVGPIFAYNMFFLIVPLFEKISIFGSGVKFGSSVGVEEIKAATGEVTLSGGLKVGHGTLVMFDVFFQLICVIVGLGVMKSASSLLSSLLGVGDLVKDGGDAMKKAISTGTTLATGATAVVGSAVHGTATAIRAGIGVVRDGSGAIRKGAEKRRDKKEMLAEYQGRVDDYNKQIDKLDRDQENGNGYVDEGTYRSVRDSLVEKREEFNINNLTRKEKKEAFSKFASKRAGERLSEAEEDFNAKEISATQAKLALDAEKAKPKYKQDKDLINSLQSEYDRQYSSMREAGNTMRVARSRKDSLTKKPLSNFKDAILDEREGGEKSWIGKASSLIDQGAGKLQKAAPILFGKGTLLGDIMKGSAEDFNKFASAGNKDQRLRFRNFLTTATKDTGFDTLYKYAVDPGSRKALYAHSKEGEDEKALKDEIKRQKLQKQASESIAGKNQDKDQKDFMKKVYAEQLGVSAQYAKLKGDAKADFEKRYGIEQKADEMVKNFKKTGGFDSTTQKYVDQIQNQARLDAAKQELASAKQAQALKAQVMAQAGMQEQSTKIEDDTLSKLVQKFKQLLDAENAKPRTVKMAEKQKIDIDAQKLATGLKDAITTAVQSGNASMLEVLNDIKEALKEKKN